MPKKWLWIIGAAVVAYVIWANFIQKSKVTSVANNSGMVG